MTVKQRACIDWICSTLGVKYYGRDNITDASKFISKFIDRARETQRESNFYNAWGLSFFFGRRFGGYIK